jgi:protein tyrosine phosphatase (PTP) superfamily phosphohydrolase (DUF442 family)
MPLPEETPAETARPEKWAVKIEKPGLPNFHRVTENLYRGAQPSAEGMRALADMGVKTVVNLRLMHSDRDEIGSLPLDYVHIRAEAWDPDWDEIVRFLRVATDERRQPVFVHCQHGADRTGLMCAVYRVAVCGWSKEEAIREMTGGGFGFHKIWDDIVPYIQKLNVEKLEKDARLGDQPDSKEPGGQPGRFSRPEGKDEGEERERRKTVWKGSAPFDLPEAGCPDNLMGAHPSTLLL